MHDHVICVVCAAGVGPLACRNATYAAASLQEPRPASMHTNLQSCKCYTLLATAVLMAGEHISHELLHKLDMHAGTHGYCGMYFAAPTAQLCCN